MRWGDWSRDKATTAENSAIYKDELTQSWARVSDVRAHEDERSFHTWPAINLGFIILVV